MPTQRYTGVSPQEVMERRIRNHLVRNSDKVRRELSSLPIHPSRDMISRVQARDYVNRTIRKHPVSQTARLSLGLVVDEMYRFRPSWNMMELYMFLQARNATEDDDLITELLSLAQAVTALYWLPDVRTRLEKIIAHREMSDAATMLAQTVVETMFETADDIDIVDFSWEIRKVAHSLREGQRVV